MLSLYHVIWRIIRRKTRAGRAVGDMDLQACERSGRVGYLTIEVGKWGEWCLERERRVRARLRASERGGREWARAR